MKKLILTVMVCCSLCCGFASVSNAFIWLFPPSVSCWDENGDCYECKKTGNPDACRRCEEMKNRPAPTDTSDDGV